MYDLPNSISVPFRGTILLFHRCTILLFLKIIIPKSWRCIPGSSDTPLAISVSIFCDFSNLLVPMYWRTTPFVDEHKRSFSPSANKKLTYWGSFKSHLIVITYFKGLLRVQIQKWLTCVVSTVNQVIECSRQGQ